MPQDHPHSISLVRQFHETFSHPVAKKVTPGDAKLRRLRVKLLASELIEFAQAAGVPLELEVKPSLKPPALEDGETHMNNMLGRLFVDPAPLCAQDEFADLVEMADALADIDYVCQGANLVFGFPSALVVQEVHRSNMSKLDADGKPIYDEDGKVVKGPNYFKPDIEALLHNFDPAAEL